MLFVFCVRGGKASGGKATEGALRRCFFPELAASIGPHTEDHRTSQTDFFSLHLPLRSTLFYHGRLLEGSNGGLIPVLLDRASSLSCADIRGPNYPDRGCLLHHQCIAVGILASDLQAPVRRPKALRRIIRGMIEGAVIDGPVSSSPDLRP